MRKSDSGKRSDNFRSEVLDGQKGIGPRALKEGLDSDSNRNSSAFMVGGKVRCREWVELVVRSCESSLLTTSFSSVK